MPDDAHGVARKIWAYANVLYDDGVNSRDYVEQITCLMFLKMEDERVERLGEKSVIPKKHNWKTFRDLDGDDLETDIIIILEAAMETRVATEIAVECRSTPGREIHGRALNVGRRGATR